MSLVSYYCQIDLVRNECPCTDEKAKKKKKKKRKEADESACDASVLDASQATEADESIVKVRVTRFCCTGRL